MFFIILGTLLALYLTYRTMPGLIEGLRDRGYVARDMYKDGKPEVATQGGILILLILILVVSCYALGVQLLTGLARNLPFLANDLFLDDIQVNSQTRDINEQIAFTIILFGLFGILDDYVEISYKLKTILPVLFTIPVMSVVGISTKIYFFDVSLPSETTFTVFEGVKAFGGTFDMQIQYEWILRYVFVPVVIIVVAQLVNAHSGFNGQASGLSIIILFTIIIKARVWQGTTNDIVVAGALLGALVGFWYYNRYPARIFEGNIGALMVGSGIGAVLVVKGFIISGIIMFIPHFINILLGFYWLFMRPHHPGDVRYMEAKFGRLREDGTLVVPSPYTVKWLLPYFSDKGYTEQECVNFTYRLTAICCAIAFFVPM